MSPVKSPIHRLGLVAALFLATLAVPMSAAAQQSTDGQIDSDFATPVVVAAQTEVSVGQDLTLTIAGFRSAFVLVSFCGNSAQRGSPDCNMIASGAVQLRRDGSSTVFRLPVAEPPGPCPCVVRVAAADSNEVAVAVITLIGHQLAPVVPSEIQMVDPIEVDLSVERAAHGLGPWLRSSLGGRTVYEATVTLHNRSTFRVDGIAVAGTAGRTGDDVLTNFALPDSVSLGPNETLRSVLRTELPSPVLGDVLWRVDVSGGAMLTTVARDQSSHRPVLLFVLLGLLVCDLVLLAYRMFRKVQAVRSLAHPEPMMVPIS